LVVNANPSPRERPPTLTEDTLILPSLSPVGDKPISAVIDDRCTSADVLLLQDVERRLNLADRLAACLQDPRQPGKITHRLDEILRFRMLAIVAGYPDGNDCDVLRGDPVFKMALDRPPVTGPALCSQRLYERKYCQRGRMENLLKAHKLHLASDRTSCTRACANQVRLFLHGAAYWLLWTFQSLMPKRSPWRVVQFDTLRNRLIKLVAEVTETADRIRIALAPVFPVEDILTVVSVRLARFVT
jgi:hypothetical protein